VKFPIAVKSRSKSHAFFAFEKYASGINFRGMLQRILTRKKNYLLRHLSSPSLSLSLSLSEEAY